MREVAVEGFVGESPARVRQHLTPERVVAYEGSFEVDRVETAGDATFVTATGPGLELTLRFEEREGGLYYTQEGDAGPFAAMETWVDVSPEDEGSRVRLASAVELAAPLPFGDRLAGWKRRGELKRALEALRTDVE
ncbi:MAG: SRPBCC family protein [Haloferacaceae archaeon]